MKTRSLLQVNLIALITLCLNPLFSSDSDLEMALLAHDVQSFASGSATASTETDDRTGSNSSNASTTTAILIGESDSNSSTNTPPKPHNPHTEITIDDTWTDDDAAFLKAFIEKPNTTTAFLNQLNRSLHDEWGVKTWVGYLALGTAYGFYGWTDASYMQLTESWALPDAMLCIMEQATYDRIYGFAYKQQRFTAFAGKLAYGAIGECLEWAASFAKRYEFKLSNFPKIISPNADFTAIETNAYAKSRLLTNTAGLALAAGSAMVDAALYKRYLATTYDASPNDITFWPIWLGAGLTLDNFNDVLDLTCTGFAKLCKTQTGTMHEQRQHLKELFAKAQYHLQISNDSEIEAIYNQFTAAGNGTADINIDQLQLLTAAGANTALPNRWKRDLTTKSMAALFTAANIYNWWVLGNGIMNLNVAQVDSPTAASAALGTLNVAIFAPLTYAGMVQMGNGIIDTFAPQSSQLPHANHRSENNAIKRALQMLHVPVAFTLCAAGALAATSFSLYFTLYPELPFAAANNTAVNYSDYYNYTADDNSSISNATEDDSCAGYYGNDISFFYNQPWYMVQTAAFLVAANSRPAAKALQIMRAAPTKIADTAAGMYNKVRNWCGYEMLQPTMTPSHMRDTMMAVILTAVFMLKNANDTAITNLYSDINAENLPKPQAKP